jgi:hypothetical protein
LRNGTDVRLSGCIYSLCLAPGPIAFVDHNSDPLATGQNKFIVFIVKVTFLGPDRPPGCRAGVKRQFGHWVTDIAAPISEFTHFTTRIHISIPEITKLHQKSLIQQIWKQTRTLTQARAGERVYSSKNWEKVAKASERVLKKLASWPKLAQAGLTWPKLANQYGTHHSYVLVVHTLRNAKRH